MILHGDAHGQDCDCVERAGPGGGAGDGDRAPAAAISGAAD
jgi:hypothetical protein